jgi:endonuclease G
MPSKAHTLLQSKYTKEGEKSQGFFEKKMKILRFSAVFYGFLLFTAPIGAQTFPPGCEIPLCGGNDESDHAGHEIHAYTGFTLCYRDAYELSEWSAYAMTREKLEVVTKRSDHFQSDPHITTGSARPDDYRGSGFDRGHLAPAADMRWSVQAMEDSFYMSNMCPQTPRLNRGVWLHLESAVRQLTEAYGTVLVTTGPLLDAPPEAFEAIGFSCRIVVPRFFYKVLAAYVPDPAADGEPAYHLQTIGFIIDNASPSGDYHAYAVTVDEVEALTGLDFFAALTDDEEDVAESTFDITLW